WQTSPMADKRTKQTDSGGWLNKGIGYPQRGKERWGDYAGAGVRCKIAGFLTHSHFPGAFMQHRQLSAHEAIWYDPQWLADPAVPVFDPAHWHQHNRIMG